MNGRAVAGKNASYITIMHVARKQYGGKQNGSNTQLKLVKPEGKTCYLKKKRGKNSRKPIKIGLGFLRDWLKGRHRRSN